MKRHRDADSGAGRGRGEGRPNGVYEAIIYARAGRNITFSNHSAPSSPLYLFPPRPARPPARLVACPLAAGGLPLSPPSASFTSHLSGSSVSEGSAEPRRCARAALFITIYSDS